MAGTNNITIDTQDGDTIQNQSSVSINVDNGHLKAISNGNDWYVTSSGAP
jgi:hypothetical protein